MKIGAIIQARTSSSRLPGKVLKELPFGSGVTVLENVIRRVKRCKEIDHIIVATTDKPVDKKIVSVVKRAKAGYFCGDEKDVLSRYYLAAKEYGLDAVVRICSDSPCLDPVVVDMLVKKYVNTKADYASNMLVHKYPLGLNAEIFGFGSLGKAYKSVKKDYEKEHVTPFFYRNPDKFKISSLDAPASLSRLNLRLTLDTLEDYALLCAVFDYLYPTDKYFNVDKIVKLFIKKPWLKNINANIMQKSIAPARERYRKNI